MTEMFKSLGSMFKTQFSNFNFWTILDLIIVAYFIYLVIQLLKETRAVQLLKGLAMLVVLLELSGLIGLETTNYVLKNSLQVGLIAVIIVFQPELRRALEQFGRKGFFINPNGEKSTTEELMHLIEEISIACGSMSLKKIGALIIIERQTKLADVIETGTIVDAQASASMFGSLFFPNSPMHDGAVIVRGTRIYAAGCFLPLTKNDALSRELGTRHRAALGISEVSDALVLVVSEETGKISLVENGNIARGFSKDELKFELTKRLVEFTDKPNTPFKKLFRKEEPKK